MTAAKMAAPATIRRNAFSESLTAGGSTNSTKIAISSIAAAVRTAFRLASRTMALLPRFWAPYLFSTTKTGDAMAQPHSTDAPASSDDRLEDFADFLDQLDENQELSAGS